MSFINHLFVTLAFLAFALFGAMIVAGVFRRLKYSDVPRHEAVFFDIGFVFLTSFVALAVVLVGGWLFFHRRKTVPEHNA